MEIFPILYSLWNCSLFSVGVFFEARGLSQKLVSESLEGWGVAVRLYWL